MAYLFLFLVGVAASVLGALLGIGGGIVIVPSLVLFLKMPMQNAAAISLATIVVISVVTTTQNIRKHLVDIKLALILEISTAFFAILASHIAIGTSQYILQEIFGVFLILISFSMLRKIHLPLSNLNGQIKHFYFDPELRKKVYYNIKNLKAAVFASSLAGFASGSLGIGGGVLKVPILNEVCRIPMRVATATSNLMVGITAAAASIVYFQYNYLNLNFVLWVALGAIVGAQAGLLIKRRLDNSTIRKIFAIIMLLFGIAMAAKAFI